jgi:hypothetical protein
MSHTNGQGSGPGAGSRTAGGPPPRPDFVRGGGRAQRPPPRPDFRRGGGEAQGGGGDGGGGGGWWALGIGIVFLAVVMIVEIGESDGASGGGQRSTGSQPISTYQYQAASRYNTNQVNVDPLERQRQLMSSFGMPSQADPMSPFSATSPLNPMSVQGSGFPSVSTGIGQSFGATGRQSLIPRPGTSNYGRGVSSFGATSRPASRPSTGGFGGGSSSFGGGSSFGSAGFTSVPNWP